MQVEMSENYIEFIYKLLRLLLLWPNNKNEDVKTSSYLKWFIVTCILVVPGFLNFVHLFCSLRDGTGAQILDMMVIIQMIIIVQQVFAFVIGIKKLVRLYHEMFDFEKHEPKHRYQHVSRKMNILAQFSMFYSITSIICVAILNYNLNENCYGPEITMNYKHYICGTMFPIYVPMEVEAEYVKIFIVFWTILFNIVFISMLVGSFFYQCSMLEFLSLKIDHLNEQLSQITTILSTEEKRRRIIIYLRFQHKIIRLQNMFNDCLSITNAVMYLFTAILFAIFEYLVMKEHKFQEICNMGGFLFLVFYMCFLGQKLINKAEITGWTAYNLQWYEMDVSLRCYVQMLILRAQHPIVVKAGPIVHLSYVQLLTIVTTSFTYLTYISNN